MEKLKCPHCGNGELNKVSATPPYDPDHLQCSACDSTFMPEAITRNSVPLDSGSVEDEAT